MHAAITSVDLCHAWMLKFQVHKYQSDISDNNNLVAAYQGSDQKQGWSALYQELLFDSSSRTWIGFIRCLIKTLPNFIPPLQIAV